MLNCRGRFARVLAVNSVVIFAIFMLVHKAARFHTSHLATPSAHSLSLTALTLCPLPRSPSVEFFPWSRYLDDAERLSAVDPRCDRIHLMLVGHSRMRQLYQGLVGAARLKQIRRGDNTAFATIPLADEDHVAARGRITPPPHQVINTTCLAAWPLPHYDPPNWRCSRAAASARILVDFRWRSQLAHIEQLVARLLAAERRDQLPDVLLITGGLYQLPFQTSTAPGPKKESWWLRPSQLLDTLERLAEQLQLLRRRQRLHVLWQLEQPASSMSNYDNPTNQRQLNVINAAVHESLLRRGVPVWSAHTALVVDWVTSVCPLDDIHSEDTRRTCRTEIYHVDERTVALITEQLWTFLRHHAGLGFVEDERG